MMLTMQVHTVYLAIETDYSYSDYSEYLERVIGVTYDDYDEALKMILHRKDEINKVNEEDPYKLASDESCRLLIRKYRVGNYYPDTEELAYLWHRKNEVVLFEYDEEAKKLLPTKNPEWEDEDW